MPKYVYVGVERRLYYPPGAPAVDAEPGKTYTLAADPGDGRWEPAKKPAPNTDPAPAGDNKE